MNDSFDFFICIAHFYQCVIIRLWVGYGWNIIKVKYTSGCDKEQLDGLIHISQISLDRVTNVSQYLTIGQLVEAKITEIDQEKNRVSLSIKELLEEAAAEEEEAETAEEAAEEAEATEEASEEE